MLYQHLHLCLVAVLTLKNVGLFIEMKGFGRHLSNG